MRHDEGRSGDANALLIDPSVVGQSHLLVNTGVIHLALGRYARLALITEVGHCEALKKYLGPEICERIIFVTWRRRSDIRKTVRDFIAGKQFDQIIFTNIEYDMFLYMNLFQSKASKKPILWVLHSHFVNAAGPGVGLRIKNLVKWYFFFRAFPQAKFVVLGERIRTNIEALIGPFFRRGNIVAIIHPVGVARLAKRGPALSTRPHRVIFMSGWHALSPSNQELLSALEGVPSETRRFEVVAVSNTFEGSFKEKSFSAEYADRLKQIAEADFFLHLPNDPYRLQASGAVMDMLLTGTPVIGLRTDFGDELAEIIGLFGYFFDNREDLLRFLSSGEPDPAEVAMFRSNLAAGYEKIVALSHTQFDNLLAS